MDTQLVPPDSTQAPTLQAKMHRRQLQLAREVQHAALTVEAEQTLHHKLLLELESYAKTLEDWVNQPGRSPAQQQYVQASTSTHHNRGTRDAAGTVCLMLALSPRSGRHDHPRQRRKRRYDEPITPGSVR